MQKNHFVSTKQLQQLDMVSRDVKTFTSKLKLFWDN